VYRVVCDYQYNAVECLQEHHPHRYRSKHCYGQQPFLDLAGIGQWLDLRLSFHQGCELGVPMSKWDGDILEEALAVRQCLDGDSITWLVTLRRQQQWIDLDFVDDDAGGDGINQPLLDVAGPGWLGRLTGGGGVGHDGGPEQPRALPAS
jgi:hypothetical protein